MKARTIRTSPPEHEAVMEGDRRFFRRHRDRAHRMRLTSRAEMDMAARAGFRFGVPREGYRWVTVLRQIAPGFRMKQTCQLPEGMDTDASEAVCADLYDFLAGKPGTICEEIFGGRIFAVDVPIAEGLQ